MPSTMIDGVQASVRGFRVPNDIDSRPVKNLACDLMSIDDLTSICHEIRVKLYPLASIAIPIHNCCRMSNVD